MASPIPITLEVTMNNATCQNCLYGEKETIYYVRCLYWLYRVENYTPNANVIVDYPLEDNVPAKSLVMPKTFGCNQWVKDEPVNLPDYQE